MGQKVHPYGLSLGIKKPWKSRWFVEGGYDKLLVEDVKLKAELREKLKAAGVSSVEPTRLPRLVDAEAQPIRMDFLSHSFPLLVCPLRLSRWAVVQNFKFTRNCLLRALFGCSLLAGCLLRGGLLGCRLCRCLLRGLLRCR